MARIVTVNKDSVNLPNGGTYMTGDTAVLTEEQYASLDGDAFAGGEPILTDEGYQSDVVVVSPDGTAFRVVVGNDGTLDTEEITG